MYLLDYKWLGENFTAKRQTVANQQQQPPVATGKTINMFTIENQM